MTTANDIVTLALQTAGVLGVGQNVLPENSNGALRILNMMLGQWNRRRWLVYHLVDTAFNATGAQTYSVGTGGNFNIARPDRLEYAYFRQSGIPQPIDYPLSILESREDYSRIAQKTLTSWPLYAFYDSGYPLGTLYVWPIPSNQYQIHIVTKAVLSTFATLATAVSLPPEYEEALYYNLAVRLRPVYQLDPDSQLTSLAKAALETVRASNTQVARLTMPVGLTRPALYNIYSDQMY